ncbi:CCA tRNA nucleotidyltransferase [bacterium]|nr:CCA tRNA nucleotidyltransferase [bacterium]
MNINLHNKLNKEILDILDKCIQAANISNIHIYLVGGIVRDILLSRPIKDIDITIVGNVADFIYVLKSVADVADVQFIKNLPTAKVKFSNNISIDFASTRKEIYKNFGDLPTITETGCNLEYDIQRRDFTINTLIISLNKENLFEVIDFTNGLQDLQNKKLRILHDKSFYDDPSRIIRGLKFAERLNFEIEKHTLSLQKEYLENPLQNIPLERVKKEIKDLFLLNKSSCFDNFIKYKIYKLFVSKYNFNLNGEKIKNIVKIFNISREDCWLLYFLPLFQVENPPEKLNLTVREKKIIKDLQYYRGFSQIKNDKFSVYEFFKDKDYLSVIFFGMVYNLDIAREYFNIKNVKINVTGQDIIQLGIPQGKIYSEIRKYILKEKLNNNNLKTKEEEIEFIKQLLQERKTLE